jgi:hypothetical protein
LNRLELSPLWLPFRRIMGRLILGLHKGATEPMQAGQHQGDAARSGSSPFMQHSSTVTKNDLRWSYR